MLSKTKVVKRARKAIESLYDGKCTIIEHQKVKKANKSTGFTDVPVLTDQPCRLSFKTIQSTQQLDNAASALTQATILFLSPEIRLKPGSKISVLQNDVETDYQASGEPALYDTHQEIPLELFKGWA